MPLSTTKLESLKPRAKPYEVADGGGLFVEVLPKPALGARSAGRVFRYRYRLFGKREKVTIGRYPDVSLAIAREKHAEYRTMVAAGKSPARQKKASGAAEAQAESFKEFAQFWMSDSDSGDDWRENQRLWLERDVYPSIGARRLKDITPQDVLSLIDSIKARSAPHSALRVRGIIKQVYDFAIARQRAAFNPAVAIPTKIIVRPQSRARVLSEIEIRAFCAALDACNALEPNKLALRLIFLTLTRKGELRQAKWEHVDCDNAQWHLPETKNGKPHIVYLSRQATALFARLRELAGSSPWVMPSVSDSRKPIGDTTLNSVLYGIELAHLRKGGKWQRFTPHDLRRTASTILHEQGFNTDVIEKALNHTMRGVRGVYNRAQYADQRMEMLQHWADYLESVNERERVTSIQGSAV